MPVRRTIHRLCILALIASAGCVDDNTDPDPEPSADTGPGSDMAPTPDTGPDPDAGPDAAPGCEDGAEQPCDIEGGCVGTETCVDGAFGECVPPAEICDMADNDCDGEIDEGLQCGCAVSIPPSITLPADPQDFVAEQDIGEEGWDDGGNDAFDTYGQLTLRAGGESIALDMSLGSREGSVGGVDFTVDSVLDGNLWTVTVSPVDADAAGPLDAFMDGDLGSDESTAPETLFGQGLPVLRTTDDVAEPDDVPVFTALVTADITDIADIAYVSAPEVEEVSIVAPGIELPFTLAIALSYADPQAVTDAIGAGFLGMCVQPATEICSNAADDDGDGDVDCDDGDCAGTRQCDDRRGMLRLADGDDDNSGRLELFYKGTWATICDDGWSEEQGLANGDVACRELGFPLGVAALEIEAPDGAGPIALDDVQCAGDEERLLDCPSNGLGNHNCSHDEDVRLRCLLEGECRSDAGCAEGEVCVDFGCIVPPDEVCDDGEDNDLDGAADCEDDDCAEFEACQPDPPVTVFVTSDTMPGNLGGLAGADAICNARAATAGLAGEYMAWLANDEGDPAGRFRRNNGPYVRVDGVEIAANWDDLVDGEIAAPIAIDENGAEVVHNTLDGWAWTAAAADGTGPVGGNCENWRGTGQGSKGNTETTDANWARNGNPSNFNCDRQPGRLYCFQQP